MTTRASTVPGSRRRELLVDLGLAVPLALLAVGGTVGEMVSVDGPHPPAAGAYAIAVVAAAPLVWRRAWPALAATASFLVAALYVVLGYPGWAPVIVLYVALFSLTAYGATYRSLAGAIGLCLLVCVLPTLGPEGWSPALPAVWAVATTLVWVSLLGAATRRRRLDNEQRLRETAEVAAARARQRMVDDRLQVARELHDVLAHSIGVITVQSGLAADALDDDTETARAALGAIRSSAREAMGELRATLALLRADPSSGPGEDGIGAPTAPQPRLDQLPVLIRQAEAAGVRVRFQGPQDGPVPPEIELTAYRVVQEALTNVVRHARAGRADVRVERDAAELRIEVTDDGTGPARSDGRGTGDGTDGFGITGMRERVAAVGGSLSVGPGPSGGYRVLAALPLVPPPG